MDSNSIFRYPPHVFLFLQVIDFGAAVILEEDEQVISGGRVGTWTYWAPEQASLINYDSG